MSERILKINKLIKEELGKLLLTEVDFPKSVFVTISRIETSQDLMCVQVFLSIFPNESQRLVLKTLQSQIFRLQHILNKRLKTRRVPKIKFEIDKAEEYAEKVEGLLEELDNR